MLFDPGPNPWKHGGEYYEEDQLIKRERVMEPILSANESGRYLCEEYHQEASTSNARMSRTSIYP